jgi:hypothetical protein
MRRIAKELLQNALEIIGRATGVDEALYVCEEELQIFYRECLEGGT